jgi:HEAT repeat protein
MRKHRVRVLSIGCLLLGLAACGRREEKPDIPKLISELKSPREEVRGRAGVALAAVGEPAAVPLTELLRDPDPRVRLLGAQTLWTLGPRAKAVVPQITEALKDESVPVRMNATMALEAIGFPAASATPALIALLRDPDWSVRQHAAQALGAIGPDAKSAVPALTRAARDDFTRDAATKALQKIQGPH